MSAAREAAVAVAVLKTLADQIRLARQQADRDVLGVLDPGDRKHAALSDGTDVGTVSVSKGRTAVKVADDRKFLAWVKAHAPTEVEERVRDSYRKRLVENAVVTAEGVVDPRTGELVDGLEVTTGGPSVSVRQSEEQKLNVAAAWRDGRLAEILARAVRLEIEQ